MIKSFKIFLFLILNLVLLRPALAEEAGFWILDQGQKTSKERKVELSEGDTWELCLQVGLPEGKWLSLKAIFEESSQENLGFEINWQPQDFDEARACYVVQWKAPKGLTKGTYQLADLRIMSLHGGWLSLKEELYKFVRADEWEVTAMPKPVLKVIHPMSKEKPLKFKGDWLKLKLKQRFDFEGLKPPVKLRAIYRVESTPQPTYEVYEAKCSKKFSSFVCKLKARWPQITYQGKKVKLSLDSLILEGESGPIGVWDEEEDFRACISEDSGKMYLFEEASCPLLWSLFAFLLG